jgi:hypothetical protein
MEKFNGFIIQKKVIHHGRFQFELISEYWSNGVMVKGLMAFLSALQYSITPVLQGPDIQELLATLKLPFPWS